MGLAPTTSTTMMVALGDALALALLERKGFSSADLAGFIRAAGSGAGCCGCATSCTKPTKSP